VQFHRRLDDSPPRLCLLLGTLAEAIDAFLKFQCTPLFNEY
jgi:hypothetical protein